MDTNPNISHDPNPIGQPPEIVDKYKEYLNTLNDALPKLIDQVKPDFIFFQAGVDVLETDRLGKFLYLEKVVKIEIELF